MGLGWFNWFCAVSDCSVADTLSFEGLARVVCYSVVHDDKATGSPSVGALVFVHESSKVHQDIVRHRAIVTKYNSLLAVVPLVNPSRVSSDHLVEKDFVAVGADPDGWKHLADYLTSAVGQPLPCCSLGCHIFFGFFFCFALEG